MFLRVVEKVLLGLIIMMPAPPALKSVAMATMPSIHAVKLTMTDLRDKLVAEVASR